MCQQYLGLSNNPALIEEAKKSVEKYGFGLSSVRFICERKMSTKNLKQKFLHSWNGRYDLYSSCFDANAGLFETPGKEDAIISDSLNHASIIDGKIMQSLRFDTKTTIWQILKQS